MASRLAAHRNEPERLTLRTTDSSTPPMPILLPLPTDWPRCESAMRSGVPKHDHQGFCAGQAKQHPISVSYTSTWRRQASSLDESTPFDLVIDEARVNRVRWGRPSRHRYIDNDINLGIDLEVCLVYLGLSLAGQWVPRCGLQPLGEAWVL